MLYRFLVIAATALQPILGADGVVPLRVQRVKMHEPEAGAAPVALESLRAQEKSEQKAQTQTQTTSLAGSQRKRHEPGRHERHGYGHEREYERDHAKDFHEKHRHGKHRDKHDERPPKENEIQ